MSYIDLFLESDQQMSDYIVYILRAIQGRRIATYDKLYEILSDEIPVVDETIKRKIRVVRDSVNVLGAQIDILKDDRGAFIADAKCTCHPIFLPLNVSQVMALLLGLYYMREDKIFAETVEKEANYIWTQLTPYCRDIIKRKWANYTGFILWIDKREEIKIKFEKENETLGEKSADSKIMSYTKMNKKPLSFKIDGADKEVMECNPCEECHWKLVYKDGSEEIRHSEEINIPI